MPTIIHQRRARAHLQRDIELQEFIDRMTDVAARKKLRSRAIYREALAELVFLAFCEGFAYGQRRPRTGLPVALYGSLRRQHLRRGAEVRFRRVAD